MRKKRAISKRLGKEMLTLENDLMISDLVIEDLELDGKKKTRLIQELEVKVEEKIRYMLAVIIVAISVIVVLLSSCGKVLQM